MDIRGKLAQSNGRLRTAHVEVTIEQRGNSYLRSGWNWLKAVLHKRMTIFFALLFGC